MSERTSVVSAEALGPRSREELLKMDAYWRAANYLSVGQIYLLSNPLPTEPLPVEQTKPRLVGRGALPRVSTSSTSA